MDGLFEEDLQGKKSKLRDINIAKGRANEFVNTAVQNSKKLPQAVVKITGYSKSIKALKAHTRYITTKSKSSTKGVSGNEVTDKTLKKKIREWIELDGGTKEKSRVAMKMVLSAPAGSDPKAVEKAVKNFASNAFAKNNDYYHALHTDTHNPHVHIVVRMRGYDGKKLDPRKNDIQKWRKSFSKMLEKEGILTASTSRASRGVGKKGERQAVKHIKKKGGESYADAENNKSLNTIEREALPWEIKQQLTNQAYKKNYKLLGESMVKSKDEDISKQGKEIIKMSNNLAKPETRLQEAERLKISAKDRER